MSNKHNNWSMEFLDATEHSRNRAEYVPLPENIVATTLTSDEIIEMQHNDVTHSNSNVIIPVTSSTSLLNPPLKSRGGFSKKKYWHEDFISTKTRTF